MKVWLFLLVICGLQSVRALWPEPSKYTAGTKYVKLGKPLEVRLGGSLTPSKDLKAAIEEVSKYVNEDGMRPLEVDLGTIEKAAQATKHVVSYLELHIGADSAQPAGSIADNINMPFEKRDESYKLEVSRRNQELR